MRALVFVFFGLCCNVHFLLAAISLERSDSKHPNSAPQLRISGGEIEGGWFDLVLRMNDAQAPTLYMNDKVWKASCREGKRVILRSGQPGQDYATKCPGLKFAGVSNADRSVTPVDTKSLKKNLVVDGKVRLSEPALLFNAPNGAQYAVLYNALSMGLGAWSWSHPGQRERLPIRGNAVFAWPQNGVGPLYAFKDNGHVIDQKFVIKPIVDSTSKKDSVTVSPKDIVRFSVDNKMDKKELEYERMERCVHSKNGAPLRYLETICFHFKGETVITWKHLSMMILGTKVKGQLVYSIKRAVKGKTVNMLNKQREVKVQRKPWVFDAEEALSLPIYEAAQTKSQIKADKHPDLIVMGTTQTRTLRETENRKDPGTYIKEHGPCKYKGFNGQKRLEFKCGTRALEFSAKEFSKLILERKVGRARMEWRFNDPLTISEVNPLMYYPLDKEYPAKASVGSKAMYDDYGDAYSQQPYDYVTERTPRLLRLLH